VALVDDDEIEEFRRDAGIVDNVWRFALPGPGGIERRALFVARVELGLAFQHGIEALDSRDHDFGRGVDRVRFQALYSVQGWELAGIVGRLEVGELVFGLLSEVAAIDKEEDSFGRRELE
jgi:hypothetical protein